MEDIRGPMAVSWLIVFVIVFVFIGIPILKKSSQTSKKVFGEYEIGGEKTEKAKIVAKRIYTPSGSIERINFIIFELESGERIELAIRNDEQYKMMLEGDVGKLTHIGSKFVSFLR